MLPQTNSNDPGRDECYTPPYAAEPLLPLLAERGFTKVWEPAAGNPRSRVLAATLQQAELQVKATGLPEYDFFKTAPPAGTQIQITNPPFTLKYKWLERSVNIGLPFALLFPVSALGAASLQKYLTHLDIILTSPRIDYIMPFAGVLGKGSTFASMWITQGLSDQKIIVHKFLGKPKRADRLAAYREWMQQAESFSNDY